MAKPTRKYPHVTTAAMIERVERLRAAIERDVFDGVLVPDLQRIFDRAERALAEQAWLLRTLDTARDGTIVRSATNVANVDRAMERLGREVRKWIVKPGNKWADVAIPIVEQAGVNLAAANLSTQHVTPDMIGAVYRHVPRGIPGVLAVGANRTHTIMGTVGLDVQDWFRGTMMDAIVEGVPVQGPGDTLATRLYRSGRIRPTVIKTQNGGTITRSLKTRANAIARVEMARIMGDVHETYAERALGDEAVYVNSNPRDSRTTNICSAASREPPHPLEWWIASRFGRAPRHRPFHLCRSILIGGQPHWFED